MQKIIIVLGLTGIVAVSGALFAITITNSMLAQQAKKMTKSGASVTDTALTKPSQQASLTQANAYVITWETAGFDRSQKVDINLIEMISESPAIYKFIKKIATNTANDGQENWYPENGEFGSNSYIEVTCSNSISRDGCRIIGKPIALVQ
jgi:hypothetical protein